MPEIVSASNLRWSAVGWGLRGVEYVSSGGIHADQAAHDMTPPGPGIPGPIPLLSL
jgi:hypothetical protein